MPRKPVFFRLASLAVRLLGRERFQRVLRPVLEAGLRGRAKELAPVLERLRGGPPSALELDSWLSALAERYAESRASLYTLGEPGGPPVELAETLAVLRSLRAEGRGVILATPHFGNHVAAVAALAASGVPLTLQLVSAPPYRWLEGLYPALRCAGLGESASACLAALARQETVWLYADLDFFPGGRTGALFGGAVRPPHGPARLALASSAPILPVYCVFKGPGHVLEHDEPLRPLGRRQEELESALLASMERRLARHPDHWFLFRNPWDLEGSDREARRRFALMRGLALSGGGL